MSFFSRMSGAKEAGTTTQPTRIFTGAAWARAGRPIASAELAAKALRLNWRRLNRVFMTFPPVFRRNGYYLSARRAIQLGEGFVSARPQGVTPRAGPQLRLRGVGNGCDFKGHTARSLHLR